MQEVIKSLQERFLCAQYTDETALQELFSNEKLVIYLGIDPTAESLHVGNLVPLRQLKFFADHGQRCIVLFGEGTTHIGDPSGKTETRRMLDEDKIAANTRRIAAQVESLMQAWGCSVECVNNAEWLLDLNYVDFLRDIGSQFSVNRMLSFESYRQRMERGLSFIEFNYQVLQAYDYFVLHRDHGCNLQIGGDDQWGNILAGVELIRRKTQQQSYAVTAPLLTTASGGKMGKTEKGSVYLDPVLTTPFDFFQYWRNVADTDVEKLLLIYTDYSTEVVKELTAVKGASINTAKKKLALAVTSYVHGEQKAMQLAESTESMFAGRKSELSEIPSKDVPAAYIQKKLPLVSVFVEVGLCKSTSEARRFIAQGGLYVNDDQVNSHEALLDETKLDNGNVHLRVGKKRVYILRVV